MGAGAVTNETLIMIITLLALVGGVFAVFANIRERLAKIETNIEHIFRALGIQHRQENREE